MRALLIVGKNKDLARACLQLIREVSFSDEDAQSIPEDRVLVVGAYFSYTAINKNLILIL